MAVTSHFLDSGAYSLRRKAKGAVDYPAYMDRYAEFVRENAEAVDLYANVDVIGDPEATWRNQKYLEGLGLTPVPVVHYGTSLKWLRHYLERDYHTVGLGGLVGNTRKAKGFLDACFGLVHATKDGMPRARLHGFGVVNHRLLVRYPWWSVDSAAWVKEAGRWAAVFVPRRRGGDFDFLAAPYKVLMADSVLGSKSYRKGEPRSGNTHYRDLSLGERALTDLWLVRVGESAEGEGGCVSSQAARCRANLRFFEALRAALSPWPRPWRRGARGLAASEPERAGSVGGRPRPLRIYYSGGGGNPDTGPEALLGRDVSVMMTFYDMPSRRFDALLGARRAGAPAK